MRQIWVATGFEIEERRVGVGVGGWKNERVGLLVDESGGIMRCEEDEILLVGKKKKESIYFIFIIFYIFIRFYFFICHINFLIRDRGDK